MIHPIKIDQNLQKYISYGRQMTSNPSSKESPKAHTTRESATRYTQMSGGHLFSHRNKP